MESGIGHPDIALYRLVKGGDSGLNLNLEDIFDKHIEIPSLFDIVKSFFTRQPIMITLRAFPRDIIEKLMHMQSGVDELVKREVDKAKYKGGI